MLRTILTRQRQCVAFNRPLLTSRPSYSSPHLTRPLLGPKLLKRAAATRFSTLLLDKLLIALNLVRKYLCFEPTLADRNTSTKHVTSSAALHPASPFPHSSTQTPATKLHSFHFRDQFRMLEELALGTATVNVIIIGLV
ncbi:hypothetical protein GWK47_046470 [Chionoecetes opilio]|uniref:Uncharacterized protein n=1 Tax=Chionoecetes opilio TaxID=41210 RepID=A0A8J5CWC6_CHIOP|nr:hypothetical protein GWK47_046470 [Chionoecetes opilio]